MKTRGFDPAQGRELFMVSLDSAAGFPGSPLLEVEHFVCLVVWDAEGADVDQASRVTSALIRQGATYLMFWGAGCSRLHAIADECFVALEPELSLPEGTTVMTTDHADESLDEALWFFLTLSSPTPPLDETTCAGLVVVVDSDARASQVAHGLEDPEALIERVLAEEG